MVHTARAVRITRQSIGAIARNRWRIAKRYRQLSEKAAAQYEHSASITDLNQAIQLLKLAVSPVPVCWYARQARWLIDLGFMLHDRYVQLGKMADINQAVKFMTRAVNMISEPSYKALSLHSLAVAFGSRYDHTKAIAELDRSIRAHKKAVDTVLDHPDRFEWLNDLGVRLYDRYKEKSAVIDLDEAVRVLENATATTHNHPDRVTWLCNLGATLDHQYELSKKPSKLDELISVISEVVDLTPHDCVDCADRLEHLGVRLIDRWELTAAVTDLENVISTARLFLEVARDHPRQARWYDKLGAGLTERYHQTQELSLLEEAIEVTRKAVALTDYDHPLKAKFFNNLGSRLGDMYVHTSLTSNYEEAIELLRKAVDMTPDDSADKLIWMYSLGNRLGYHHNETGNATDLDESIQILHHILERTSHGHPYRAMWLDNLAGKLSDRYEYIGSVEDLEEALEITREAVKITSGDNHERAHYLENLGRQLANKYHRGQNICDLEEAISATRESIKITPEGHPKRGSRLNSLSVILHEYGLRSRDDASVEEAINTVRECIRQWPGDDSDQKEWLYNLGTFLGDRHDQFKTISDLEDCIELLKKVVVSTSAGYPRRPQWLRSLGSRLTDRYDLWKQMSDVEDARACFRSALEQHTGPVGERIRAGDELLLNCLYTSSWDEAYEAAKIVIGLVPKLTRRSLQAADMQYRLGQISGLGRDAAAVALHCQDDPFPALSLLESGRDVIATSLEDKRADVSNLRRAFPELAKEFLHLCNELDSFGSERRVTLTEPILPVSEDLVARRSKADQRLNELVTEIREKPSFSTFLLQPSQQEMCSAAENGPIVIINVSVFRCDAILVVAGGVRSLQLSETLLEEAFNRANEKNLGSPEMLEWLWNTIMKPILEALGFTNPIRDSNWPHVWWVPTGILSKFPLHAAGHHKRKSGESVIDRVMSSYSSSVKTIVQRRQTRPTEIESQNPRNALLVSMESTPNYTTKLHFADKEVGIVQGLCQEIGLSPSKSTCYKNDVLRCIPDCQVFHFAGHGCTNSSDPSKSYLALRDWKNDPLTVTDLFGLNLRSSPPFLAYLSACGTGQVKDDDLRDENMHLISAFQLAGFRHVIGTLWEVADEVCVDIAKLTYEGIRDGKMSDESVCLGLHQATRALRERWLADLNQEHKDSRKERDVIVCDDDDEDGANGVLQWVPYVHYGV